jgi:hypothetical protein
VKTSKLREFPRYKVVDLHELKGNIENVGFPLQLATFSRGGCGFYCVERIPMFSAPRRVFCTFTMAGIAKQPVRVQGNLVYCREVSAKSKTVMFYGIEFIKPHRPHIEKIAGELERLYDDGQIHKAR